MLTTNATVPSTTPAPASGNRSAEHGDCDDRAWLYGELDIDPESPDGNPYWDQDAYDYAVARNALMDRFRSGDISGDEYRALAADLWRQRHASLQRPTRSAPPAGPFHLNEYRTTRRFGGQEEGGWWYDAGAFVKCHGTFPTREAATSARDAKTEWLVDRRRGLHPPSDARSTLTAAGWPELRIEPRPGADFPAERPRYQ